MSHLRAFVANQVLLRIRAFLGLFCPDFYSDIEDFTQILCRYLPKKLAVGTSECGPASKALHFYLQQIFSAGFICDLLHIAFLQADMAAKLVRKYTSCLKSQKWCN